MKRTIALAFAVALSATRLAAQDIPLSKILVEKEGWREVAMDLPKISFLHGRPDGEVDIWQQETHSRIDKKGAVGKLDIPIGKQLVRDARVVSSQSGDGYYIHPSGELLHTQPLGRKDRLILDGLKAPACLMLWPDDGHLVIGESDGAYLWAVRFEKDGSFGPGDRYYSLRTKPGEKMHVTAMTMDAGYLLFACTPLGIQVFDPTGRLSGVIAAPSKEAMTAITIGGAKADELFVAAGEKIYARKIQGKASYTLKK